MEMKNVNKVLDEKIARQANIFYRLGNCTRCSNGPKMTKEEAFQKAWELWNEYKFDYDMLKIDKDYIMSLIED